MFSKTYGLNGLSSEELQKFAQKLAHQAQKHDVIALFGELGAGKTDFAKAFIRALTRPDEDVPSPTFTLVQIYDAILDHVPLTVWHFDLYRLKTAEEIYEIGFEEALSCGVSLIEWPQRAEKLLPKTRLDIHIEIPFNAPDKRNLTITATGDNWRERMEKSNLCQNV